MHRKLVSSLIAALVVGFAHFAHADMAGGARVVIDQRTGTVIMTGNVRIGTVAVAHGDLAIRVTETPRVSPPGPFARVDRTVTVPSTRTRIQEGKRRRLVVLPANDTLRDLVDRFNALGAGPRDLIAILQAIKSSGALQAEIVVR